MIQINTLPPFKKMCVTIGHLPSSFMESMTYYEALEWLYKYLSDTIIPTVNTEGEAVTELQQAFTTLENYVNTYFDNLDVQEEINNKLDDMAESGQLTDIIAQYLGLAGIIAFDTVSDMKLADNLVNGSKCQTLGYHNVNDGGASLYKIRTITNDDIVDEMYIIELADNNLVAELIIDNAVSTKQCGLIGDGTTDETIKLNNFFSKHLEYNKIVNSGIYKITNTVLIKGLWRRDNNTNPKITFENATIYYDGSENGISLVLFNMFKYSIDGLSIARNSTKNFVQIIGCWHLLATNWDIQNLDITHDGTIISGQTYQTLSSEYVCFINCYMLGHVVINCSSPEYINCVNFYNSIIYSTNYDYCVKLMGTNSKQEINFYNSDLSYCTQAVFYVDAAQIGGCTVNCIGSYFDSARKMFYNDDKKNVEFNNLFTTMPANSNNEVTNITMQDWTKNMSMGGYNQFGYNLPTSNVNYALNGDMSTTGVVDGDYGFVMGLSSSSWTKTYVDSNLSTSGKARKITYIGSPSASQGLTVKSIAAPRNNTYTCYVRGKIVDGSCDSIQIGFGGKYTEIATSRIGSNEFVLVNSKEVTRNTGESLNFGIEFKGNVTTGLSVELYEVGVIDGKTYIPNTRLHAAAIIPEPE